MLSFQYLNCGLEVGWNQVFEQAVAAHRAPVPTTGARIDHEAHLGHTPLQLQILARRRRRQDW